MEFAITNANIKSVAFSDIKDLPGEFEDDFVNMTDATVTFPTDINFGTSNGAKVYTITTGTGKFINPSNSAIKFTPKELSNACSSVSLGSFEAKFSDEHLATAELPRFLNGNRQFVRLSPENLDGNIADQMYQASKVRNITLEGFVREESDFTLAPLDPNTPGSGTPFLEVFEKLAGKVHAYLNSASAGSVEANDLPNVNGELEIDNTRVGKTIFVDDSAKLKLLDSINNEAEFTIKRVDADGVNPKM